MSHKMLDRREFIERAIALGAVAAGASTVLVACKSGGGGLDCTDVSGLTPDELTLRETNAYVEVSTVPDKDCTNCQLYTTAPEGQCGGCTVVKGPINPAGYCNLWAEKIS